MYRQIRVHPDDTDLQRILWREDPNQPVTTYRLKTVTYGTASAPFLATRCLHQLAQDEAGDFPLVAPIVTRDFYVDDLLTGAPTMTRVRALRDDVSELLARGGFHLHKWNSNCPELLETPLDPGFSQATQLISNESVKTLGIQWNSTEDTLSYQAKPPRSSERLTKRSILALIAGIFDPLGLLGPLIITAKIMIQQLWQLKIEWDETVPVATYTAWKRYEMDLQNIGTIKIPRHVIASDLKPIVVQLHGFCDSSETAYGACIYLRSTLQEGVHVSSLLCAKSRVAPLKTVSIPRLELCSALLLAQLAAKATAALNITIQSQHYWSDSTIALAWIEASPHLWKTFVANRTTQIQELTTSGTWHHVRTLENPADILSRGATMNDLQHNRLWWHGPEWLVQNEELWTVPLFTIATESPLPEARASSIALVTSIEPFPLLERYSSLTKLTSVVAYCIRFKNNCLNPRDRHTGALEVSEREVAFRCIIKRCQNDVFRAEIEQLRKENQVSSKSRLLTLLPFLDEHAVLRVGGRIQRADVSAEQKHQIILPAKHRLTTLIITHEHVKNLHAGVLATLASVRLRFWPLTGRQTTKGILRTCIKCFKAKPTFQNPQMGNLPHFRANPSRPFSVTGIDFCGPLHIREGGPRSRKTVKCYISVFVYFATKAVHLELVGNLTTEAFLGALKRFFGRRGKCTHIFSDNATNFVGAHRELTVLKDLFSSEIHLHRVKTFLAEDGVVWGFIPANSPHFGGLWEAAVKSTKHHLRRVLGDASLSFEELSTVLAQVESCLNSRPLTPLSSDSNDLQCLTPGHFLIGDALNAYGEPSLTSIPVNRLSRWQRVQQLTQHFWTRWSKEYLSQLQQRHKWNQPSGQQLAIGTMVIIRDDHAPPLQWPLGRVSEVHPGTDGIVRVVTLRTRGGFLKRAVSKVCVLPLEQ